MPSALYTFAGIVSQPVKLLFRLRASGVENLPAEGGFVLAANHTSNFDPWPLGLPLFPRRQLRFMAKSELYWFPLTPVLNGAGAFPVRRGERDLEAIQTAVELCRAGEVVVMFPEGTRRRKGLREEARGAAAHRRGADRDRGGRAARAGGGEGHRPAVPARAAPRRLREPLAPGGDAARADRAADGGDRPAAGDAVSSRGRCS